MLRLDFKTVCARAKKLKPHIEISHNSRLDHSEIIDLSYRAKKDDCTMTASNITPNPSEVIPKVSEP